MQRHGPWSLTHLSTGARAVVFSASNYRDTEGQADTAKAYKCDQISVISARAQVSDLRICMNGLRSHRKSKADSSFDCPSPRLGPLPPSHTPSMPNLPLSHTAASFQSGTAAKALASKLWQTANFLHGNIVRHATNCEVQPLNTTEPQNTTVTKARACQIAFWGIHVECFSPTVFIREWPTKETYCTAGHLLWELRSRDSTDVYDIDSTNNQSWWLPTVTDTRLCNSE